jgi:hypothetical protein
MAPYGPRPWTKQTDAKAVVSLFLGLTSFVLGPATGIPAIILGSVSARDIDRSGGRYGGTLLARAGTVSGFFGVGFFVVFVLWIASALVAPPVNSAQGNVNEEAQAHAKVVKSAPSTPHPRGDVEAFHSIR